ncbi:MAG: efflux RND transporter periplasmic adaptor subunit [Gammaproteobacteria bacterium]
MKKLFRISAPVLVLVAGFAIVKVLAAASPEPEKNEEPQRLVSLYVDEVRADRVRVGVETQGEVRPKTEIDLIPQVSGRIVAISEAFNEGAEFAPGETLLKIDDTDYRLAVVRAEARVAEAQTELERQLATKGIKEREWRDNRARGEHATDFALNLTQVRQAEAMLRAARAELDRARLDLERTAISLPFQGRVRSRTVGIGQIVAAGVPLGRVFSTDTVEIRLPLTDQQLVELNLPLGYMASEAAPPPEVRLSGGLGDERFSWTGHLVRVNAAVDDDTRLIYATAEVRDPYGAGMSEGMPLAVGMFVNAQIEGVTERAALVMPRLALRNQDEVYVINGENRLEIRRVDVLSTSEARVLVTGGVDAGEHVVTSTVPNATDGMRVEPIFRAQRNS